MSISIADECSNNFCRTAFLRSCVRSSLTIHSSIERSSSAKASSCLTMLSVENVAVLGEFRYPTILLCRPRRPSLREIYVLLRYSQRSSKTSSSWICQHWAHDVSCNLRTFDRFDTSHSRKILNVSADLLARFLRLRSSSVGMVLRAFRLQTPPGRLSYPSSFSVSISVT